MVEALDTSAAAALREEVRTWLEENWDPERPEQEWLGMLADTGWGWPNWPRDRYGRGLPDELATVVFEEFFRIGATPGAAIGHNGLTVRDFSTDEQAELFLRPLLTGEQRWCQLFSEPSAGSDLAGLQSRAERHGDEWIVNGQKVWTSGAQGADYGLLLARTDWDVPKHQGLTMFALPMKQPGVEVRPIKQMTGAATFNEVFMTDARMPDPISVLGQQGQGWSIGMRTLSHERNRGRDAARSAAAQRVRPPAAGNGRRRRGGGRDGEAAARRGRGGTDPRQLAQQTGRGSDPVIRQQVAYVYSLQQIASWTNMRTAAAREAGKPPGPEVSIGKLLGAIITKENAVLNGQILGAGALAHDAGPHSESVVQSLLGYHASSIAAGTNDVQKNVMAERVLGLPKEPQVDVDAPFRQVQKSAAIKSFGGGA